MAKDQFLNSILSFSDQIRTSYKETHKLKFNLKSESINDVIIAGMGGSMFGGRVVLDAFINDKLQTPLSIVSGYELPAYADEKTLVIATSYSGNTAETLSVVEEALSRGCDVIAITSGGKLGKMIKENKIQGYIFNEKYNPAKAPRTGIGYVVGSTIGFLANLEFLDVTLLEMEDFCKYIHLFTEKVSMDEKLIESITAKLKYKVPVFVGCNHLKAAVLIIRNFFNETAKSMAFMETIPEMNHYFLDGLKYPDSAKENIVFLFLNSDLFADEIKTRIKVSRDVVRNKMGFLDMGLMLNGGEALKEIFEFIVIGCLVGYQLAKSNDEDPAINEMVDYLKKNLK